MNPAEQARLVSLWEGFLGDRTPTNDILRHFYLDVVIELDVYAYGIASEVFDVLINGVFDEARSHSWNARGDDRDIAAA